MASVAPPKPSHRPLLPARVITDGLLSDVQLETVIYASEAHAAHLAGSWTVDATFDTVSRCASGCGHTGCSEIIAWKLRFFVTVDAGDVAMLERLMAAHPIVRLTDRKAA